MRRGSSGHSIAWTSILSAWALGAGVAVSGVSAHAGSDEQLALVNRLIAEDPSNPDLYLKRGRVYFQDEHWDLALADYERAVGFGVDVDQADLARGELFLAAQWPSSAERFLDRLLSRRGDHARAYLLRARARTAQERLQEAADDFVAALEKSSGASPDLFLEVVQGLTRADRTDDAIRRVDQSREQFGPIGSLAHEAIEIEVAAGRFESALARLADIASKPGFQERWLLRRAEVLELAERPAEARGAYEEARRILMARPAHRRDTPALQKTAQEIESGLVRLASADE